MSREEETFVDRLNRGAPAQGTAKAEWAGAKIRFTGEDQVTVKVCKAEPIGNQVVDGIMIDISGDIPTIPRAGENWLAAYGDFYDSEAEKIFQALRQSLPGGTLDRLVGKLLEYKATHFRVLHG